MGHCGSRPQVLPILPTTVGARWAGHNFKFENLVFEGGGAKGIAYIGVCKVLEDAGILSNINRFAGTSAGAITAALFAIGLTPQEMLKELTSINLLDVVLDARCKALHWIPGMKKLIQLIDVKKGACPGKKFMKWFGEILDRHLKKRGLPLDKDVTFDQIYRVLGKELRIVAYNVNYEVESYFHVKTAPFLRVREAVRMSMSIPVAFQPYELEEPFTYIDGGLAANFPLYAFDGWYLSMDSSSTFDRLQSLDKPVANQLFYPEYRNERFKSPEAGSDDFFKTLGVLVFSRNNRETHQSLFETRLEKWQVNNLDFRNPRPPTDKKREYIDDIKGKKTLTNKEKESLQRQMEKLRTTTQHVFDAVQEGGENEARRLFCQNVTDGEIQKSVLPVQTKEEAFEMLLLDEKGKLTDKKIKNVYQNFLPLQNAKMDILGVRPVSTFGQYYGTLVDFVGRKNQFTEADVGRCIGVDVDYLSTMDFDMKPADMEFLMKQGVAAATAFLCEYIGQQVDRDNHSAAAAAPSTSGQMTPVDS